MEATYIIHGKKSENVINSENFLKKAEESNGLNIEISKYKRAINTLLNENKRIEQNERKISEEMEEIEYIIDSINNTKPLWIDGYNTNYNERGWVEPLNNDQEFLELYDFYNDINIEEYKHNISMLLSIPHNLRNDSDIKENSLNRYDEMYLKDIEVKIVGKNYSTGIHDTWGKVYIPYDICETNGVFNGNRKISGVVKYTGNNIPWYMVSVNNSEFCEQ